MLIYIAVFWEKLAWINRSVKSNNEADLTASSSIRFRISVLRRNWALLHLIKKKDEYYKYMENMKAVS